MSIFEAALFIAVPPLLVVVLVLVRMVVLTSRAMDDHQKTVAKERVL